MAYFKIFRETNDTDIEDLKREMEEYFSCRTKKIIHMNTVVEKVDGIDYITIVVCYV